MVTSLLSCWWKKELDVLFTFLHQNRVFSSLQTRECVMIIIVVFQCNSALKHTAFLSLGSKPTIVSKFICMQRERCYRNRILDISVEGGSTLTLWVFLFLKKGKRSRQKIIESSVANLLSCALLFHPEEADNEDSSDRGHCGKAAFNEREKYLKLKPGKNTQVEKTLRKQWPSVCLHVKDIYHFTSSECFRILFIYLPRGIFSYHTTYILYSI